MNNDQIGGVIRSFLALFSGWALSHGFTQDQWVAISGGVIAAITFAWSLYSNSNRQLIISTAESPTVATVVVRNPELARSIPSNKVIAAMRKP